MQWRVLDETIQAIRDRNDDLSPEELEAEIELAVREVRRGAVSPVAADHLAERAKRGDAAAALEFLVRSGGEPPRPGDERS